MRRRTAVGRFRSFLLVLGVAAVLASCGVPGAHKGPESAGERPGHADLEASVVNDRKHLFDGSLAYDPSVSVSVGDSLTFDVRLTARGGTPSHGTAQAALVTRAFQVGGVEGAALTPGDADVRVVALTDGRAQQVIAQPGDTAEWQWSVSAREPGDYGLALTVTTYQGASDRALDTLTPPITVRLRVHDTWSHRIASMKDWLIAAGGIAGALVAIYAVRAPLTEVTRARREARREARQQRDRSRTGYL